MKTDHVRLACVSLEFCREAASVTEARTCLRNESDGAMRAETSMHVADPVSGSQMAIANRLGFKRLAVESLPWLEA